jgi:hypothetical protein
MAMRTHVTFKADFPDDSQEDEGGDISVPAGRNVALALVDALRGDGLGCGDPEQHSHYGWSFEIQMSGLREWCVLQRGEECLLIGEARGPFLGSLFRNEEHLEANALRAIHAAMKRDSRFSEVLWFTAREYNAGRAARARTGHPSPD